MRRDFTFELVGRGKVIVRVPPAGAYLIDGKTGRPLEFDRKDVHSINYGGQFGELYCVLQSLTILEWRE